MNGSIEEKEGAPPSLRFSGLSFTIRQNGGCRSQPLAKQLLKGVCGVAEGGRVTAIAGPSGSGKTTLLDVLSGAHFGGRVGGTVEVDGRPIDEWIRTQHGSACYVMQHDVLPHLDTVREALTTAALLRLPRALPREAKLERVDELLELLDLVDCADLLIGDSTMGARGLSGGQRRRVTIGIELIKNPQIVFLDEPLSGLDSESGEQVVRCLARLARKGHTVLLSIHQASGSLMRFVDSLVLMAGGRVVFQGLPGQAPRFTRSLGHKPLPGQTDSEFLLAVLKDPAAAEAAADAFAAGAGGAGCGQPKDGRESPSEEGEAEGDVEAPPTASLADRRKMLLLSRSHTALVERYRPKAEQQSLDGAGAAPWTQAWVVYRRYLRWRARDRTQTIALLLLGVVGGLMIGLIFFGLSSDYTEGVFERTSAIWFITATMEVFNSNLSLVAWLATRALVRREISTGLYSPVTLFLARTIEWAGALAIGVVLLSIQYWLAGFQRVASKYFIWLLVVWLTVLGSFMLGNCIILALPDGPAAMALESAIGTVLISSNGFLTRQPPVFLAWIKQANFLTYSYTALVVNEMDGLTLEGPGGQQVTLQGTPPLTGAAHADWGLAGVIGMLAGLVGALTLAALTMLCAMVRLKRL